MQKTFAIAGVLLAAYFAAACSGERGLSCQSSARYEGASTVGPIRVPDDLSLPDESEALQVPFPPTGAASRPSDGSCLESPPDFFEGGVGAQG
jgi:uncharacterized lipoprotein